MPDPINPPEEPGDGPGKGNVPLPGIVIGSIYLVLMISGLIWGLARYWPHCEVQCAPEVVSVTSTPANTVTPTNSNTNSNAAASSSPTPVRATPTAAGATPKENPTDKTTPTPAEALAIDSVSPKTSWMGTPVQVLIKGKGFEPGATVLFGGQPATILGPVDAHAITVRPPCIPAEAEMDVAVRNIDGGGEVAKAAFNYTCPPSPDIDLFWLVVFAGALGGTLYSLRSFYWYVGVRKLTRSWTLMYAVLPFTGAAMALVFYAVIRAGLLPGQASKNSSIAFVVFAMLVGLFSQQAALKLKDIAEAFLTKPAPGPEAHPQKQLPPGGDAAPKPPAVTTKFVPANCSTAGAKGIEITGTGLKTVKSVKFGDTAATDPVLISGDTITVNAPPHTAGKVVVVVTDDEGNTATGSFEYVQP